MVGTKVSSKAEAEEAINAVAEWLATSPENAVRKPLDASEPEGADVARDFCYTLLNAARANGLGGCALCLD
jgi:hypothetical protein